MRRPWYARFQLQRSRRVTFPLWIVLWVGFTCIFLFWTSWPIVTSCHFVPSFLGGRRLFFIYCRRCLFLCLSFGTSGYSWRFFSKDKNQCFNMSSVVAQVEPKLRSDGKKLPNSVVLVSSFEHGAWGPKKCLAALDRMINFFQPRSIFGSCVWTEAAPGLLTQASGKPSVGTSTYLQSWDSRCVNHIHTVSQAAIGIWKEKLVQDFRNSTKTCKLSLLAVYASDSKLFWTSATGE